MSELNVQRLTPSDAQALMAFRGLLVESDPAAMGDERDRRYTAERCSIDRELGHGPQVTFGAFVAGKLVGCASIQPSPTIIFDECFSISAVGVSLAHRGCGAGSALVDECVKYARRHGAHRVNLRVNLPNEVALGLYQSLGFTFGARDPEAAFEHQGVQYQGQDLYLNV